MKLVKYLMPLLVAAGLTTANAYGQLLGQETSFERELRSRDDQPLREFVQSKENIDVKQKAQNLEISGDVRFEYSFIREKGIALFIHEPHIIISEEETENLMADLGEPSDIESNAPVVRVRKIPSDQLHEVYRYFQGGQHVDTDGIPISNNDFDVEFNLKIKYNFEDAWAFAHLQFDNPAGIKGRNQCFGELAILDKDGKEVKDNADRDTRRALKGSGEAFSIALKRAYIGYNIWANGKQRVDIEIGRRKLDDLFESELEFTNRFDGIALKYAGEFGEYSDFYWNSGVFLIDERVNHFGYVTEFGFLNIYELGLDLRYSFIDWVKRGRNRCFIRNPLGAEFQISQVSGAYTSKQTFCGYEIPFELYAGFLINHAAKPTKFTHNKKKNLGWYAGIYVGESNKKGDWAFDIEYIVIQALAVSDEDIGSIGRNNVFQERIGDIIDEAFICPSMQDQSMNDVDPYNAPSSGIHGYMPRRGNANFIGARAEFLYNITDNFILDFVGQFSVEEDKRIGGPHRFSSFSVEAVYAF